MPDSPDSGPRPSFTERLARLVGRPAPEVDGVKTKAGAAPALSVSIEAFKSLSVREVMISRVEISALDVDMTLGETLNRFALHRHSRMPVYRGELDDAVGFVHIKDILAELDASGMAPEVLASRPLDRLKREILFVPESMLLPELLVLMQTKRTHMALVVDEFGGIDGVVCLEDLVEQIVGDIEDEHDEQTLHIIRRGRSLWDVDASAPIEDVEAETGCRLAVADFAGEIETLGGLVTALAGRVPAKADLIKHPSGVLFEVIDADPRRILKLRMRGMSRGGAAPNDQPIDAGGERT
ncbi:CBS domain-containing protein [bacterium]|nr:CBS domain-containing protein [bacterium]